MSQRCSVKCCIKMEAKKNFFKLLRIRETSLGSLEILKQRKAFLDVRHSVIGFASAFTPLLWSFLESDWNLTTNLYRSLVCLILTIIFGLCLFPSYFDVWWRAVVTGFGASIGTYIIILPEFQGVWPFGTYLCILSMSHFLEYAVTGITNPSNLSTDSFLLNHSLYYWIAAVASWIEYFVEYYFLPAGFKDVTSLVKCGVVISIVGEILRKIAMFHLGNNFYHIVQSSKQENHELVTSGIFSYVRHPYYVGWFLWSLGTQVVLLNPICFVFYGYVLWVSFNESIYDEEESLLYFFGNGYSDYQMNVPVGIPFIQGVVLNKDKSN